MLAEDFLTERKKNEDAETFENHRDDAPRCHNTTTAQSPRTHGTPQGEQSKSTANDINKQGSQPSSAQQRSRGGRRSHLEHLQDYISEKSKEQEVSTRFRLRETKL